MTKHNENPKGLKAGDCVVRAIALATGQSWDKVFTDLCEIALKKKRMPNEKQVYETYLEKLGWEKHSQPRSTIYENGHKDTYKKYTVDEFITNLNFMNNIKREHDVYIITVAHHMTCVKYQGIDFDIYDIWDCSNKTIRNYWTKKGE